MKEFPKSVFMNRRGETRSGWKLGLLLAGYLIVQALFEKLFPGVSKSTLRLYAADCLIFLGVLFIILKWVDRKPMTEIGLTGIRGSLKDLGFGLAGGAVSMTVIFMVLAATGHIIVETAEFSRNLPVSLLEDLALFIMVGFREEIFSRGYCLLVFQQMRRLWLSVLLSSVIFALLHLNNPNVNGIAVVNILLVGFLFSFMAVKTGNLWMPIGYHITWNYFQGNIFGFPVSGYNLNGLYHIRIVRHNFLSGGLFGPEGGILATGIVLIGFVAVWLVTVGREIPERFTSRSD